MGFLNYYNAKGKYLGSDGNDDGKKSMVLLKSTARTIAKSTRKGLCISMNENVYLDIIRVPTNKEITAMDEAYKRTEIDSDHEEGFVSGFDRNDEIQIEEFKSSQDHSISMEAIDVAESGLNKTGVESIDLIVHVHPSKSDEKGTIAGIAVHSGSFESKGQDVGVLLKRDIRFSIILGYQRPNDELK